MTQARETVVNLLRNASKGVELSAKGRKRKNGRTGMIVTGGKTKGRTVTKTETRRRSEIGGVKAVTAGKGSAARKGDEARKGTTKKRESTAASDAASARRRQVRMKEAARTEEQKAGVAKLSRIGTNGDAHHPAAVIVSRSKSQASPWE